VSPSRATEPLLRELAVDLAPVRPIPRLRSAAAAVGGIFCASLAVYWLLGAPFPLAADAPLWSNLGFLAVLAGLSLVAAGALPQALAAAIPGRGSVSTIGRALGWTGGALIAAGILASFVVWGGSGVAMPLETNWVCLGRALALGLLTALAGSAYLGRGRAPSAGRAAALAALGAVALSAAVVHAGCAYTYVPHMLLGHALAPFLAALLGALPLALLIQKLSQWSASA
jgi:hypothetical protein